MLKKDEVTLKGLRPFFILSNQFFYWDWIFLQAELPGAVEFIRMWVWGTGDHNRPDPRIDSMGKICIFSDANRFAGKVIQAFPFAGALDSAIIHLKT